MIELRTVAELADRSQVDAFLGRHFRPTKATFLRDHGTWWHRGDINRWVLLEDGEVLGYCAVIPTRIAVEGEPVEGSWWVDLVIDPAARGRKLQRHFDDLIRSRPLTLGFPNALAAEIHRRHGWGVRDDLQVRLLPLEPTRMPAVSSARAWQRVLLVPALWCAGAPFGRDGGRKVEMFAEHHVAQLAALFQEARREEPRSVRTWHDETSLRWRFLEAPWADQHYVIVGREGAAVVRLLETGGSRVARVLELLGHGASRVPLLRCVAAFARRAGASQVTVLATDPATGRDARSAGLWLRSRARLCWFSHEPAIRRAFCETPHAWTIGDADNDEP